MSRRKKPRARRLLQTLDGTVFYVDSGWSKETWDVITDAMRRYSKRMSMTDETQTETQESDFAAAWRPEPGGRITGTVTNIDVIDPAGQGPYPCITVQTADGERAIHAFHQVLRTGLAKRRPKVGDEIDIVYQGKVAGGAYGGYHSYRIAGGQGQDINWDAFLPEDQQQAIPIPPAPIPQPVGTAAVQRQQRAAQEMQQKAAENFGDKPPWESEGEEPNF